MNEKQIKFGEDLIAAIMESFVTAYRLHKNGQSKEALLITYDIYAAAGDFEPTIVDAHRRAIHSAVAAFDSGVPLPVARAYMELQMRKRFEEEIANDET